VKKSILLVVLTAVLFLGLCGTAFAATPQDIWNDFNQDGDLDGTYTTGELRAYLNDATLHQYPPNASKIQSLDALIRGMLSARNRFPFTGTDIALIAVGVVAVLGAGLALRRVARART
jgi:hypothetical protein